MHNQFAGALRALPIVLLAAATPGLVAQDAKEETEQELLARARAIHERVITLDTHKDIPDMLASQKFPEDPAQLEDFRRRFDPTVRGSQQVDFPKMREGQYDVAFFIVYVGQRELNPPSYARAKSRAMLKFDAIHRMAKHYPEHIEIAYEPDDVRRIAGAGKLVACIGIENGYPMGTDLGLIEKFHELGARYMSITHNRHSQLGDSHTPADEPMHGGLSDLGRKAIEEMNRVGIMVDVSHSAKTTMLQTVAHSKAPVIASHSGCHAVNANSRNLDDEQLLALAKKGGVIQTVALSSFVKSDDERRRKISALREELGLPGRRGRRGGRAAEASTGADSEEFEKKLAEYRKRMAAIDSEFPRAGVADYVDHIDHAVKLIGIDHVAIASDFDGGGGISGWNDASETFNVTLELVRRGYSEEAIAKIWSGNTLRLWAEVAELARKLQGSGGK